MLTQEQLDELAEQYPDALRMDGYNDCIIGVSSRFGQPQITAYDRDKIVAQLKAQGMSEDEALAYQVPITAYDYDSVIANLQEQGMSYDEAVEFHDFNQAGAWVGPTTPCFVDVHDIQDNRVLIQLRLALQAYDLHMKNLPDKERKIAEMSLASPLESILAHLRKYEQEQAELIT